MMLFSQIYLFRPGSCYFLMLNIYLQFATGCPKMLAILWHLSVVNNAESLKPEKLKRKKKLSMCLVQVWIREFCQEVKCVRLFIYKQCTNVCASRFGKFFDIVEFANSILLLLSFAIYVLIMSQSKAVAGCSQGTMDDGRVYVFVYIFTAAIHIIR